MSRRRYHESDEALHHDGFCVPEACSVCLGNRLDGLQQVLKRRAQRRRKVFLFVMIASIAFAGHLLMAKHTVELFESKE